MLKFVSVIIVCVILSSCNAQKNETIEIDGIEAKTNDSIQVTKTFIGEGKDNFEYFIIEEENIDQYKLPNNFKKPENWITAEKSREEVEVYGNSYPDTFNLNDALAIIDTATNFWTICSAKSWCLKNYEHVFHHLIARLGTKKKIGLNNTADLIIWDRIGTGELKFYGHGGGMQEDLFTIAGRASWILNELTGENFAVVRGNLSREEAIAFKNQWKEYLTKLK